MIFARLENDDRMYHPAIRKALAFLRQNDVMALPLGRHDLDGDLMFANVMDMTTHGFEGSHPEVHQLYVDLMYWPEGGEKIGVAPYLGTEPVWSDPEGQDITLLNSVANESFLVATAGCFGVFFPWDAHRPALYLQEQAAVSRKVVIKIHMDLFS